MLIYSVAQVVQHVHLNCLKFSDLITDLVNFVLLFHRALLPFLLELHSSQLLVEELGLLKASLLLPDDLCRLEIIGQIMLPLIVALLLQFFFECLFLPPFFLKLDHLLISFLELQRLSLFALILCLLEPCVELLLGFLLSPDLVLQVADLFLLNALESDGIITSLLNLAHKLLFFLGKVAHASLHLGLILLGLLVLLPGDSFWAVQTLSLLLELLH